MTGCTLDRSIVVVVILWMAILMAFSDIRDILDHSGDSFIDKHCADTNVFTFGSAESFQLYLKMNP